MRKFSECTIWGDMSADSAADQYPTEPVCASCVERFDKPDLEVIVSVGRDLGERDESECYFSDQH